MQADQPQTHPIRSLLRPARRLRRASAGRKALLLCTIALLAACGSSKPGGGAAAVDAAAPDSADASTALWDQLGEIGADTPQPVDATETDLPTACTPAPLGKLGWLVGTGTLVATADGVLGRTPGAGAGEFSYWSGTGSSPVWTTPVPAVANYKMSGFVDWSFSHYGSLPWAWLESSTKVGQGLPKLLRTAMATPTGVAFEQLELPSAGLDNKIAYTFDDAGKIQACLVRFVAPDFKLVRAVRVNASAEIESPDLPLTTGVYMVACNAEAMILVEQTAPAQYHFVVWRDHGPVVNGAIPSWVSPNFIFTGASYFALIGHGPLWPVGYGANVSSGTGNSTAWAAIGGREPLLVVAEPGGLEVFGTDLRYGVSALSGTPSSHVLFDYQGNLKAVGYLESDLAAKSPIAVRASPLRWILAETVGKQYSLSACSAWGQCDLESAGPCACLTLDDCSDTNPCTADNCSPKAGGCYHVPLPDGITCSTAGGKCANGVCK